MEKEECLKKFTLSDMIGMSTKDPKYKDLKKSTGKFEHTVQNENRLFPVLNKEGVQSAPLAQNENDKEKEIVIGEIEKNIKLTEEEKDFIRKQDNKIKDETNYLHSNCPMNSTIKKMAKEFGWKSN